MGLWTHWQRTLRHLATDRRALRHALDAAALARVQAAVAASEQQHSGEIRVSVEAALPLSYLQRGLGSRERAVTLFGKLRVWDTEHNNGVLIYLLLAEHAIEIVADRGLAREVPEATWRAMMKPMREAFQASRFEEGLNQAIDAIDALLGRHFALDAGQTNANELPDRPDLR